MYDVENKKEKKKIVIVPFILCVQVLFKFYAKQNASMVSSNKKIQFLKAFIIYFILIKQEIYKVVFDG